MKSLFLPTLSGLAAIILTGCAPSVSPEDKAQLIETETKLIEYENCLEAELEQWILVGQNEGWSQSRITYLDNLRDEQDKLLSDYFIESCKKLRP